MSHPHTLPLTRAVKVQYLRYYMPSPNIITYLKAVNLLLLWRITQLHFQVAQGCVGRHMKANRFRTYWLKLFACHRHQLCYYNNAEHHGSQTVKQAPKKMVTLPEIIQA